jgi:flagellum-specific ATP synthase
MSDIVSSEQMRLAAEMREVLASYQDAEDLITIGAYKSGQNPRVDRAVQKIDAVHGFLRQQVNESVSLADSWQEMAEVIQGQ